MQLLVTYEGWLWQGGIHYSEPSLIQAPWVQGWLGMRNVQITETGVNALGYITILTIYYNYSILCYMLQYYAARARK